MRRPKSRKDRDQAACGSKRARHTLDQKHTNHILPVDEHIETPFLGAGSVRPPSSASIPRLIGLIAAMVGALLIYNGYTDLPSREELSSASGTVKWVENHRYFVKFGLVGDGRIYQYRRSSRFSNEVARELQRDGQRVSILYGPAGWIDRSHTVYEIDGPRDRIISYDDKLSSWGSTRNIGMWFGAWFCALGALLLFKRAS